MCVIGGGPRAVDFLAQLLLAFVERPPRHPVRVYVIDDSGHFGAGTTYRPDQPHYHTLNAVATNVGLQKGLFYTFTQWWQRYAAQRCGATFHGVPYHQVSGVDAPPRAVVGLYLQDAFHWLKNGGMWQELQLSSPPLVTIVPIEGAVTAVRRVEDGFHLTVSHAVTIRAHHLLLTSGHSHHSSMADVPPAYWPALTHGRLLVDAYPTERLVSSLPAGTRLGVQGLGLTSIDVILAGTIGKGGAIKTNRDGSLAYDSAGQLTYIPSGQELRITAFSRSGVLIAARGTHQKGESEYSPHFFTRDAIRRLRRQQLRRSGSRQLTFNMKMERWNERGNLFPLLWSDVQFVYYTTLLRQRHEEVAAEAFAAAFLTAAPSSKAVAALLTRFCISADEELSLARLRKPTRGLSFGSRAVFEEWHLKAIAQDVVAARLGNVNGPLKAAIDVMRDVRDVLRDAVALGGLTIESHRHLLQHFEPFHARIALGPPLVTIEIIQALARQGIIDIHTGPGAIATYIPDSRTFIIRGPETGAQADVDHLLLARIPRVDICRDSSPLMVSLLAGGLVRAFVHRQGDESFVPGGVDVDDQFRVVTADGQAQVDFHAFGVPTEGARWHNLVLSRPFNSNIIRHARHIADDINEQLHRRKRTPLRSAL